MVKSMLKLCGTLVNVSCIKKVEDLRIQPDYA